MSGLEPGRCNPLTSVIVVCTGQLTNTRLCVTALARQTRTPFELILINDGVTEGMANYLTGVADIAPFPVQVIANPNSRGWSAAVSAGLMASSGEYVVLLDQDAVVAESWLDQLEALARSNRSIGICGPMSNAASSPQRVENVPYHDLESMYRYAAEWRARHRGRWFTTKTLSRFCVLIKRAVFEVVGKADGQLGVEHFDQDEFVRLALAAGFAAAVAVDCYVHGFDRHLRPGNGTEPVSVKNSKGDPFNSAWKTETLRANCDEALPNRTTAPSSGSNLRPKVSLTMIVKNEEHNLPSCLGSIAGLFDEVVVVDTGSSDRTVAIAQEHGARVFDFPWVSDFAAARNAALARARGDYAFWLDADDVVQPNERDRLKALFESLRFGDEAAYVVRCACDPDPNGGGGSTVVDHMRLFPLREDVRWSYAVHEQILPSLRQARVPIRWSDVTVRHTGYNDPATRARKLLRDEAILRAELAERPGDPFVLFNLGFIAVERQDWSTSIAFLSKSLAGSGPTDSITAKLYALIARAHQGLGDAAGAIEACHAGRRLVPDDAELWFREAVVRRQTGDPAGAEVCWRRVLTLQRPERFSSIDVGIYGHLTRRSLAVLAEERLDRAEAASQWSQVLAECPGDAEAKANLARLHGEPS